MIDNVSYVGIIKDQTERTIWSVNNVIDCIPESYWDKIYCYMPMWKHVYHTLHSLDMWFINPRRYEEPSFHEENLNNLDAVTEKTLSRDELKEYSASVAKKINAYTDSLTDDMLLEKPEGCEYSRFALIIGQHRHLNLHTGMLMGYIIAGEGLWPRVMGMEGEIPQGEYSKFY
jgi:hypothetical protein